MILDSRRGRRRVAFFIQPAKTWAGEGVRNDQSLGLVRELHPLRIICKLLEKLASRNVLVNCKTIFSDITLYKGDIDAVRPVLC